VAWLAAPKDCPVELSRGSDRIGRTAVSSQVEVSRARWAVAGIGANVALGWMLFFPLLVMHMLVYHLAAKILDAPWSPLDGDEDVLPNLAFALSAGVPIAILAFVVNAAIRRRLRLTGWQAGLFWTAAVVVLVAPLLAVDRGWVSVRTMVGKGLVW
jgi:uncharacterized paraquat-inducible protein A